MTIFNRSAQLCIAVENVQQSWKPENILLGYADYSAANKI